MSGTTWGVACVKEVKVLKLDEMYSSNSAMYSSTIVAVMALVDIAAHPMLWWSEVLQKKIQKIVTCKGLVLDMQMATRITAVYSNRKCSQYSTF